MGINAGTIAQYGSAAQGAGAGMSAVGSYFGAQAQKMALRGAADIADINAQYSERAAQQELLRGQEAVAAATQRAGQVKSAQRAALAANGVDLGEGSAAEILTSTDIAKELDANTLTANAVRAAWGQRIQGANSTNEAIGRRSSANLISSGMAGASSLLGSSAQLAQSWYMMNKSGAAPRGT